ncbi:MAG TPA: glycosidase [Euryarchaeota archaeon]|nr:glycosidase [Euryarchaeota archaeon]
MFPPSINVKEASEVRKNITKDMVKRIGVLSPMRIRIRNYLVDTPITAFNPAMYIKDPYIYVFPRAILGYFMYVSGILRLEIPIDDLFEGILTYADYGADIVIYPTTRYDLWGTEDPRITKIEGRVYMTYVGRGINYFNPSVRYERTLPIVAETIDKRLSQWIKRAVLVLENRFRRSLVSDKDAFVVETSTDDLLVFHRPHMMDENYYLTISRINKNELLEIKNPSEIREIEVKDTKVILEPAPFEKKLGWAAPPIEIERDTFLTIIHGIDKEIEAYKVFAAIIKYEKEVGPYIKALTPYYIMEPKLLYEVFGDRPYVAFPCGMSLIDDDRILISYGAADYTIAFGELSLDAILSELDKYEIK